MGEGMCLSVTLLRIKKTPEYTCPAHDNNSSVWALFRAGVKLTHVSPDKVYALLLKKKKTLCQSYIRACICKNIRKYTIPKVTPEVWMQVEAKIFLYVLSLFLLFLSYQQFPLPLTHHLKKIKKFLSFHWTCKNLIHMKNWHRMSSSILER